VEVQVLSSASSLGTRWVNVSLGGCSGLAARVGKAFSTGIASDALAAHS
jgi:hypothetical protein